MTETVLVAGATGYIGRAVVRGLLERGYRVRALSRERAGIEGKLDHERIQALFPSAELVVGDVTDPDRLARVLGSDAVDTVVSCLASRTGRAADAWAIDYEANRALLHVALRRSARQFVLLSAICVQRPALEFQRAKLAFEEELRKAAITHSIVRPTAFFKSLAGQIKRVREGRPFLLLGNGELTACKPISQRDLAAFVCDCLQDPTKQDAVLPIGGPGPAITPRQQGELLFSLLGQPPRFRGVPLWVFDGIVSALKTAALFWPPLRAKVELARIGRYYATESMLLWDDARARYDAEATPSFGSDTLEEFYRDAIARPEPAAELGDHSVFS